MVLLTDLGETPLFKPSPSYKQQSFPYIIDCFFFHLLLFIGNWEKTHQIVRKLCWFLHEFPMYVKVFSP